MRSFGKALYLELELVRSQPRAVTGPACWLCGSMGAKDHPLDEIFQIMAALVF